MYNNTFDQLANQYQQMMTELSTKYQQAIAQAQQALPLVTQANQFLQNPLGALQQAPPPQPQYDSAMIKDFQNDPAQIALTQTYFGEFLRDKFGQEFYATPKGKEYIAKLNENLKEYEKQWQQKDKKDTTKSKKPKKQEIDEQEQETQE